jgi:hypothetical protein
MNVRVAKSSLQVQELGRYDRRRLHGVSSLDTVRNSLRLLGASSQIGSQGFSSDGGLGATLEDFRT